MNTFEDLSTSINPQLYKNLGWANGWDQENIPPIRANCKHKGRLDSEEIGNRVTEYTCHKCRYKFKVDSGG